MWKTLRRHHWALITRAYYPRIRKSTFHFHFGQSAQCECKNNKQIWLQQSWGKHEGLRVLVRGDINWLFFCAFLLHISPAQSVAISFPKSLSLCSQAQRIRSDQGREEEADYFAPSHLIRTEVELAVWSTHSTLINPPSADWTCHPPKLFTHRRLFGFKANFMLNLFVAHYLCSGKKEVDDWADYHKLFFAFNDFAVISSFLCSWPSFRSKIRGF